MRIASLPFLALLPVALGACFLDPGACQYEHRTLVLDGTMAGTVQGVPASPISATVQLNETRGANPDFRTLNLMLTGQAGGSPSTAELRDATTSPATVLATWTDLPGNANVELLTASPSHETLAALARAGKLRLALLFGAAGSDGTMEGALTVTTDGAWRHPRCD